jgi:hypothetical protein
MQYTKVILSPVKPESSAERPDMQSLHSAMKRLQYLLDQITRSETMIELNTDVILTVIQEFKTLRDLPSNCEVMDEPFESINQTLQGQRFLCKNIRCLSKRATDLSTHVSRFIETKSRLILQHKGVWSREQ